MFKIGKTFSSYSVDDLGRAKEFYAGVLGLDVDQQAEGLALHVEGGRVFLYPKPNHQAASFTVFNFEVPEIDAAVAQLAAKGVRFERYDLPDLKTDDQGIHRGTRGPRAIAWFKDPAGNILSVIQAS